MTAAWLMTRLRVTGCTPALANVAANMAAVSVVISVAQAWMYRSSAAYGLAPRSLSNTPASLRV